MTFIVGLTGGIGCGKSTIEKMFADHDGVEIIDTDIIVRELQEPGQAGFVFIRQAFGEAYFNFDGTLNRDMLRNTVFNDKQAKEKLLNIMTPLIYHCVVTKIAEIRRYPGRTQYIILTVPLLLESKIFTKLVDHILVVDCPEDVQVKRVMKRSNISKQDVEKILAAQCPRYFRIMKADDVIHNYGCEPSSIQNVVDELHIRYLELAEAAQAE